MAHSKNAPFIIFELFFNDVKPTLMIKRSSAFIEIIHLVTVLRKQLRYTEDKWTMNVHAVDGGLLKLDVVEVEIKKVEPKKASNPPPATAFARDSRTRSFGDGIGGYSDSYFGGGDFGPYRTPVSRR
ncbi:hypothetical protein Syun_009130 [Stephania yunnanensis]|uniref:Uncharacterized protein n=1 Tax=Stephania yunnanensis TaxID=152371 RepID=A0AAP0PS05_9MAGN